MANKDYAKGHAGAYGFTQPGDMVSAFAPRGRTIPQDNTRSFSYNVNNMLRQTEMRRAQEMGINPEAYARPAPPTETFVSSFPRGGGSAFQPRQSASPQDQYGGQDQASILDFIRPPENPYVGSFDIRGDNSGPTFVVGDRTFEDEAPTQQRGIGFGPMGFLNSSVTGLAQPQSQPKFGRDLANEYAQQRGDEDRNLHAELVQRGMIGGGEDALAREQRTKELEMRIGADLAKARRAEKSDQREQRIKFLQSQLDETNKELDYLKSDYAADEDKKKPGFKMWRNVPDVNKRASEIKSEIDTLTKGKQGRSAQTQPDLSQGAPIQRDIYRVPPAEFIQEAVERGLTPEQAQQIWQNDESVREYYRANGNKL